ncbi:MAG: hypothetical protein WBY53_17310 [Acidobacteriaceae bacterium]
MTSNPSHLPSRPRTHLTPPGPQLVPQRTPPLRPAQRSPLALWHLLSLDAPTVAALWTIFIARCNHVALPWTAAAAMFVAVWMIYAADRLLDARALDAYPVHSPTSHDLEARHRFHHHHRTRFLTVLLIAALALTALLLRLDERALHLYALLATLLAAWMLLIHIRPTPNGTTRRLPKELAVGIFFPAAIFIPTLARTTPTAAAIQHLGPLALWLRPNLLLSAALFASICTLNCLCLYAWEHPAPRLNAHWTTRWATHHLTHISIAILTASTLTAILTLHNPATALPATACALSAAALLTLHHLRRRLSPIHLRAAADLVLLTPLLLLPFTR